MNRHYGRISRPILDRIDISISLQRVSFDELSGKHGIERRDEEGNKNNVLTNTADKSDGITAFKYTSESMKSVVERVWKIQQERLGDDRCNSRMTNEEIRKYCELDRESERLMRDAYERYGLSARAYYKTLKVARTLADIEGEERIGYTHILEALSYRVKDKGAEQL